MAKIESYAPGSFCWAELATTDAAAAKQFYGEMFGWTAVDMPMPEGVYTLLQSGGNDAAAVYTPGPGVPVHWGVYFSVASADESAAQIEPCGGKLIAGPFDAHDAGRMAIGQDPQGAVFSLWRQARGGACKSNRAPGLAADGSFPRPKESLQPSVLLVGCRCATNFFDRAQPDALNSPQGYC